MSRFFLLLPAVLLLAGCELFGVSPPPPPPAHYVVGEPYQTGGVWHYPREQFDYTDTGIATVAARPPGLTADGEAFDQGVLAAAHRTLQLPALARVTDLRTGRAVLVRINDRGPAEPGRLIALTRRAAELLGEPAGAPFRVRVQTLETESRQLAAALAPVQKLQVDTAPVAAIQAESLAPPPGAAQSGRVRVAAAGPLPVRGTSTGAAPPPVPLRLPEQVWQLRPSSGSLYVECGTFARLQYATVLQARLAGLGARVSTDYYAPRDAAFRVRLGPLPDIAAADTALDRALRAGVSDARIIVDDF